MNIYKLPVRLDTVISDEVQKEIQPLLDNNKYVVFDFSECVYISSSGIRILIGSKKKLMRKQGDLYLANVSQVVSSVLEMSGMTAIFVIKPTVDEALKAIKEVENQQLQKFDFDFEGHTFKFEKNVEKSTDIVVWDDVTLASFDELQFAVGEGLSADDVEFDKNKAVPFFSTGQCVGFFDSQDSFNSDFRISVQPTKTGVYVKECVSFGKTPFGFLKGENNCKLTLQQFLSMTVACKTQHYPEMLDDSLCVIAQRDENQPSIIIVYQKGGSFSGGAFLLENGFSVTTDSNFGASIAKNLSLDNTLEIKQLNFDLILENPVCAMFFANKKINFKDTRLVVEMDKNEPSLELYQEFLARRIYTDSAKIVVHKLHGGFSAQTFQVNSFDFEGRRLRPTVMKMAAKDMINRESANCIRYAQPYILNNCAQILGTEFFGEKGALRYNFVGIGGDQSHVKWLTDYYLKEPFETLKPIFDKIFKQILMPWYGQGIRTRQKPFLCCDPTLTFFPYIYDEVKKVLNVDSDEKYVYIKELQRDMLCPYWMLKHIYPQQRDFEIDYFEGICHGDLNMQNILLDEKNNVFLIDFSETKTRLAISDFARLEAIIMLENSKFSSEEDHAEYISFLIKFYEETQSIHDDDFPKVEYKGKNQDFINKNIQLTRVLRNYALECVHGEKNAIPYYFALLEWILPEVCYYGDMDTKAKRLSMIVAGLLCEKVLLWFNKNE